MAKIITHAQLPQYQAEWPINQRLSCDRCGCVWEIEVGDSYTVESRPEVFQKVSMPCPECDEVADKVSLVGLYQPVVPPTETPS